jgi:hypothetical protein
MTNTRSNGLKNVQYHYRTYFAELQNGNFDFSRVFTPCNKPKLSKIMGKPVAETLPRRIRHGKDLVVWRNESVVPA